MRTVLTAAGVSIGVGLIVALLSITAGVRNTADQLIHLGRSDFGLFQKGTSDLTKSVLPQTLERQIGALRDVQEVAGLELFVTKVGNESSFLVFGMQPGQFAWQRLVVISGHLPASGQVILGDGASRSLHAVNGESIVISGRPFRVVGIYHSGNSSEDASAVMPLAALQKLTLKSDEVTTIAIVVSPRRPTKDVAQEIETRFPNVVAVREPTQAVKVDTSSRLLISAGWIFSLLALIVGGIGVMNTMAMSVLERTHEIGILRAVGWTGWRIAILIVSEAVGICLLALAIGLGVGVLAAHLFTSYGLLSSLVVPDFTASVFAWGLAFSLGVGVIGAIYPALRAIRLTPIEALRRD